MYNDGRFEWDEAKNRFNIRWHKISFETAKLVFDDLDRIVEKDLIDPETGEQRWTALGLAGGFVLLIVAHVYRKDANSENEITRIISARKASPGECEDYYD